MQNGATRNKPWAVLKVSRQQYEKARPWKTAGMDRKTFEEIVCVLPEGFVDHCHMEADAERLASAIFGGC